MFSEKKLNYKSKRNKNNSARLRFNRYNENYANTGENWNVSVPIHLTSINYTFKPVFTSFLLT